jgi:hypothetical protein
LYDEIVQQGKLDEDLSKFDCMHFPYVADGMTEETLEELFQLFYRSHFQSPKTLLGYLSMIWKSPDSWLRLLRDFGRFIRFARSDKRYGGAADG